MLKEIIISKDEYETRAALLENKAMAELSIERRGERYVLGNIYKGRVNSILPGMQAAFIDIGLGRNMKIFWMLTTVGIQNPSKGSGAITEKEMGILPSGNCSKKDRRYWFKSIKNLWTLKGQGLLLI